jgi:hypothetical protein
LAHGFYPDCVVLADCFEVFPQECDDAPHPTDADVARWAAIGFET